MRVVRGALTVALVAVLGSWPATAIAESRVWRDATGDVAQSRVGSNVYAPAPAQAQGDIVRTRVVHAARAIWIQVRFRDLTTKANGNFHLVAIRSDRRVRTIEVNAFPGHWEGTATMRNKRGVAVACAITHRLDYARHRLMLRVPRTCVGKKSSWVRVGVRSTVAGTTSVYTDDARATGTVGVTPRYGPRVVR
jgi:hypothetical protein